MPEKTEQVIKCGARLVALSEDTLSCPSHRGHLAVKLPHRVQPGTAVSARLSRALLLCSKTLP